MSDDEYYADSPYDEFEEMLWHVDPGRNLADDLAQHTAYSPVWQDDPAGDLESYHSDWEYYSDDYFDDDPAILKNDLADGTQTEKSKAGSASANRGKKRKLSESYETSRHLGNECLSSTIRGTVWAKEVASNIETFRHGEHQKVALLTDWRERFQVHKKRRSSPSRRKLDRDESWANELGLADMGLTRVEERTGNKQETVHEENGPDEEGDRSSDYNAAVDGRSAVQVGDDQKRVIETPSEQAPDNTVPDGAGLDGVNITTEGNCEASELDDSEADRDSRVGKRPRLSTASSTRKLRHKERNSKSQQPADDAEGSQNGAEHTYGRAHYASQKQGASTEEEPLSIFEGTTTRGGRATKKRKPSTSSEETLGSATSVTNSRAKRVASSKRNSKKVNSKEHELAATNTRAAKAPRR